MQNQHIKRVLQRQHWHFPCALRCVLEKWQKAAYGLSSLWHYVVHPALCGWLAEADTLGFSVLLLYLEKGLSGLFFRDFISLHIFYMPYCPHCVLWLGPADTFNVRGIMMTPVESICTCSFMNIKSIENEVLCSVIKSCLCCHMAHFASHSCWTIF